jgi:hypothetical protein
MLTSRLATYQRIICSREARSYNVDFTNKILPVHMYTLDLVQDQYVCIQ